MKKLYLTLIMILFSISCGILFSACGSNSFTVTFDTNGGSVIQAIEVEKGQKADKPTDPTRDGYTFDGWYVDNTEFTEENKWSFIGYSVTEDLTLYAKWITHTYTISYDKNKPSNARADLLGSTNNSVHKYDESKQLSTNNYTLSGWSFVGWNTANDGSGTSYADKQIVLNLMAENDSTIILYAQWIESGERPTFIFKTAAAALREAHFNLEERDFSTVIQASLLLNDVSADLYKKEFTTSSNCFNMDFPTNDILSYRLTNDVYYKLELKVRSETFENILGELLSSGTQEALSVQEIMMPVDVTAYISKYGDFLQINYSFTVTVCIHMPNGDLIATGTLNISETFQYGE